LAGIYGSDTEITWHTIKVPGIVMGRLDWVLRKATFFGNPEVDEIQKHEQAWCDRAEESFGLSGKLCVIYSEVAPNGEIVHTRADAPLKFEDGLSGFVGHPIVADIELSNMGDKLLSAFEI